MVKGGDIDCVMPPIPGDMDDVMPTMAGDMDCVVVGCCVRLTFATAAPAAPALVATLDLLLLTLPLGDSGKFACSFCLCLNSKSRRAKHRSQMGHWNGRSLVCERS